MRQRFTLLRRGRATAENIFTRVRRRGILRTSPFGDSRKFAGTEFSKKFARDPFLAHIGDASPFLTRVDCLVAQRLAPARVSERGKERHIMAAEDEVRQASEQFYAALNRVLEESDTGPMGEIWSHGSDVS